MSMSPSQAIIEGLSGTGASSVSSLSAVGLAARAGHDMGSTTDMIRPLTRWERARLPVGLMLMAVGVGAAAYAITRSTTQKSSPSVAVAPPSAAPTTTTTGNKEGAPEVPLSALPVDSSAPPSEVTMEPTPDAPTRGGSRAAPKGTGTAPPTAKRKSWRQDPGF